MAADGRDVNRKLSLGASRTILDSRTVGLGDLYEHIPLAEKEV